MSESTPSTLPAPTTMSTAPDHHQPQQQAVQVQAAAPVSSDTPPASVTATAAAAVAVSPIPINGNSPNGSRANDDLSCLWQNCTEKCASAEALYEHVCERHVGRKSTNNLNLTCQWGSCRTTTVKRDHITSHIRVHVPLKPHKCEFCGKAFKRPQDLKKHVKTHADDSVLIRSPEPGSRNPDMMFGGNAKGYATAAAHYFEPTMNGLPTPGYAQAPPQYYQSHPPPQPSNPSYGNVYYALSQGQDGGHVSYESKKRGYDALNEFFGDLKRRQFDTQSYAAVGQRLLNLQNLQLPLLAGGPVPEYQAMPAPVAVGAGGGGGGGGGGGYSPSGPHPAPAYHLPPMSNIRTKNDLVDIDRFLEQMQNTIYENDDHVAAAGVAQPGAHYIHNGMNYRTTNSPPSQLSPSHAAASAGAPLNHHHHHHHHHGSIHSPTTGTPALTPPSSAQSYTSGRSPAAHRVSPQHESTASMYPRLPSATMADSMTAAGYPTVSSAAPPSTLGGIFDHDDRRRYTGGTLQRARPEERRLSGQMDLDDTKDNKEAAKEISSSLIDPALHSGPSSAASPSSSDAERTLQTAKAATEVAERADVQWVEKVRIIEYLRNYIASRLEHGEFDSRSPRETETTKMQSPGETTMQSPAMGHDDQMEGVEKEEHTTTPQPQPESSDSVLYPTLRGLDQDDDSKMIEA